MSDPGPYVDHRLGYARRISRAVMVGSVQVGGNTPVVVQSMCTTPTQDVAATIAQSIKLAEAGCEIVRITAPGVKDAQALKAIRAGFDAAGFRKVPIVADIHFMPAAALEAVEHIEKVRINPGNYADKKRFAVKDYSDTEYAAEVERVAERFRPLVRRAKELGRCLRIGTNHGSLSDRIMNRFGDTPLGMVESAMEFIRFAEAENFRDIIISMKASNPKVMVAAYRLLVARLRKHGEPYPLHLGVTEAGDGEDGRVKSAAGIGALLEDGIGDTIRVSLTEPPEFEIPVAQALVARYASWRAFSPPVSRPVEAINPYVWQRRTAEIVRLAEVPVGGAQVAKVAIADRAAVGTPPADIILEDPNLWLSESRQVPGWVGGNQSGVRRALAATTRTGVPVIHLRNGQPSPHIPDGAIILFGLADGNPTEDLHHALALLPDAVAVGIAEAGIIGETRAYRLLAAVIEGEFRAAEARSLGSGKRIPICIGLPFVRDDLSAAAIAGGLLIDGIGDLLYLPSVQDPRRLAFTILQSVKARTTRADYVACPSCGRTQFDLFEVTAHIREVTGHLDGVSIAIMGCIVNGPGEMADAHFGFVGSGPGKVDLYRGKEVVRRNIPFASGRDELVALIKEAGMWKEPT
ncbi:MAG: (E)-4-hydroxy-3-methylbut-2-enyl-diphosphate synthase [Planctomycetota bacterium]